MGSLVLCGVALESELRSSVPVATMTGMRWLWTTRSAQALHISLAELVVKVEAVSHGRVWSIVGRPVVVLNMIVFHNDICAFVSVFDRFSVNKPVKFSSS
jgi:hypothetical protein